MKTPRLILITIALCALSRGADMMPSITSACNADGSCTVRLAFPEGQAGQTIQGLALPSPVNFLQAQSVPDGWMFAANVLVSQNGWNSGSLELTLVQQPGVSPEPLLSGLVQARFLLPLDDAEDPVGDGDDKAINAYLAKFTKPAGTILVPKYERSGGIVPLLYDIIGAAREGGSDFSFLLGLRSYKVPENLVFPDGYPAAAEAPAASLARSERTRSIRKAPPTFHLKEGLDPKIIEGLKQQGATVRNQEVTLEALRDQPAKTKAEAVTFYQLRAMMQELLNEASAQEGVTAKANQMLAVWSSNLQLVY